MKYKHNILYTHLYSPSCNRKLDYKQLMKYYNLLFCVGQKIVKFSVISMLYFKTKNSSDCYLFLGLNLGLLLTTVSHLSNCRALITLTAPIAKSNGLMSVCLSCLRRIVTLDYCALYVGVAGAGPGSGSKPTFSYFFSSV